ncbi:MAG: PKD domain-containing protein [Aggregatilineales bacterium]
MTREPLAVTGSPSATPSPTAIDDDRSAIVVPTPLPFPTPLSGIVTVPTAAVIVPMPGQAQNTAAPVNIAILSPAPNMVVSGAVQVIGSASHPQFLQYQLEFGPDPNPGNLWYQATNTVQTPVNNGLLGVWNTLPIQDGTYQLRLRVYLRDGTLLSTIVNNLRLQNRQPTPVPSATASVARPIAAFSSDVVSGQVPLTVRFSNQSAGEIDQYRWEFGDGASSAEASPVHTYTTPGLYTAVLTVSGPGGSSNVSRQISAQSPTAPTANFSLSTTSGDAPLTVQFTDQSAGAVTARFWNFSDGTSSAEPNPVHTFTRPGIYNVFLTVTGPGGSSTTSRQITVAASITETPSPTPMPPATETMQQSTGVMLTDTPPPLPTIALTAIEPTAEIPTDVPQPAPTLSAPPVAQFFADPPSGAAPLTVTFRNQSTGTIDRYEWDFTNDGTIDSREFEPTHTFLEGGLYTVSLTVYDAAGLTASQMLTIEVLQPPAPAPNAASAPILSDLGDRALIDELRNRYARGANEQGRQPTRFSIAGDEVLAAHGVLRPFAPGGSYALDSHGDLQNIIDWYNSDAETAPSFDRDGVASGSGWPLSRLLDPAATNPSLCDPGETPLSCEIRLHSPSLILVSGGYHDAAGGTNAADFRATLEQVVMSISAEGVIPVLMTAPPRSGIDPALLNALNDEVLNVGRDFRVPVLNLWRVVSELPGSQFDPGSVAPSSAGDLSSSATTNYTVNAVNLALLRALNDIRNTVFP